MPIYEYDCSDCGERFEIFVRSSDQKLLCPECQSENIARRLSTFAATAGGPDAPPGPC